MPYTFVPKGKDITTRNGCICKNNYINNSNQEIKEECTLDTDIDPWCYTKEECGLNTLAGDNKGRYWDYCNLNRTSINLKNNFFKYGKNFEKTNIIGIIIFVIIFVILIPMLLHKYDHHTILEVYMPNFDLIATSISFSGGPGKYKLFQELYNRKSVNLLGFISSSIINYLSLIGLSYLVLRRIKSTNSYISGLSVALIMLIVTYLLPNDIISILQDKLSNKINNITGIDPANGEYPYIYYFIVILFGLLIAICFILLEKFLISKHKIIFNPLFKNIIIK